MTNKANDVQVGGSHYGPGADVQHWDLAVMYQWDPFQYQITKYVMRWKDKHDTHERRLEDLKKARHFLDKYIEVAAHFERDPAPTPPPPPELPHKTPVHIAAAAHNTNLQTGDWQWEGGYGDMTNHYKCRRCGGHERAYTPAAASTQHGHCAPSVGYVQQD